MSERATKQEYGNKTEIIRTIVYTVVSELHITEDRLIQIISDKYRTVDFDVYIPEVIRELINDYILTKEIWVTERRKDFITLCDKYVSHHGDVRLVDVKQLDEDLFSLYGTKM